MKTEARRLLGTTAVVALLSIAGPMMVSQAMAQSTDLSKTQAVANTWWYHGYVEAGGRFFLNSPDKYGLPSQKGKALGKYYEYRDLRPGAISDLGIWAGTTDGLYLYGITATNIGYDDQVYTFEASKAGEHYFNFQWDETPHKYSTNARTIYNGVGSNHLTLPGGLSNQLFVQSGNVATITAANRAAIQSILEANSHQTDIGIHRDTASADYRWTPTTNWDMHADYSYLHRTGTQVDGVVFSPGTSGVAAQVPKPVDDATHNFGLNGEYIGSSPWGQAFNLKVGYQGSIYEDRWDSYLVDNPFCPPGAGVGGCARTGQVSSPMAQMSLWPSNQANGGNATLGADLPMKSRYMGTVSYISMTQNEPFLQPLYGTMVPAAAGGVAVPVPALPASGLNGQINTLTSNNVITTQITPDLKSKLSYRYYNFDNQTPELLFNNWVLTDTASAKGVSGAYAAVHSLSISYTKQNAAADLNWRPDREWNIGGGYSWEHYDWARADATSTNENGGKLYVDWKPMTWVTARASAVYSQRRADNYDYLANVGNFQWVAGGSTQYNNAMRQFYLSDRDRTKGQFSIAVDVIRGLTVTPTFGFQDDVYNVPIDPTVTQGGGTMVGLTRSQSWRAGVDLAWMADPRTTFLFSYMNEQRSQQLRATTSGTALAPGNTYQTDVQDQVNTFMGAVNYIAIPDRLDLKVSYTLSLSDDSQPITFYTGSIGTQPYPEVKNQWERLEASAKYTFDKDMTSATLGPNGQMYARLLYSWERNSAMNWQNDIMQTYMANQTNAGYGYMTWMAFDNPNYNVHLIGATLGIKW